MTKEIEIPSDDKIIKGILSLPTDPKGLVIFAHGSGSGRLSPRNKFVAEALQKSGLATLLIDLLTPKEELNRKNVFDIPLLAKRLESATKWSQQTKETKGLSVGYFGASTGVAAALQAAAELSGDIYAVVSRGGRPDLAMDYLSKVSAPTLLIVGANDEAVIPLNEVALKRLKTKKQLVIIPGATHLFEEPGALEQVAHLAADWFRKFLVK